uniref:Uncharacterized protein n=1 Tax=Romanomermis culicivorax TaxID=13658 RepID=A0A915IWY0_ROMCU
MTKDTFAAPPICIKIVSTANSCLSTSTGAIRKLMEKAVYMIRKEIGCCENSMEKLKNFPS